MSLLAKLKKNSILENAAVLSKSELMKNNEYIPIPVPMMNVAFSGKFDGGLTNGLLQLAGPSKHFKSNMALVLCKSFMDKYPEAVLMFYDSEFGSTDDYFRNAGIDPDRVIHLPFNNIEELKFDIMKQLEVIDPKTDKVMIYVDSVGNAASKKEVEDALKGSSSADMTRAKQIKSVFRMVTPFLTTKKIPMVVINHTYQTQEMYSKTVVSGGTGIQYSSNQIFIIGKRQVKDGDELGGFEFVLNCDKSRFIKEKSAIPITVLFNGGIQKYSGLLDVALATGHVVKPKNGWYTRPKYDNERNWRKAQTDCEEFWGPLLNDQSFKDDVEEMFSLTSSKLFTFDEEGSEGVLLTGVKPNEAVDTSTGEILTLDDEYSEEESEEDVV